MAILSYRASAAAARSDWANRADRCRAHARRPDIGFRHRGVARHLDALEQAFAFGGADDAATHRLEEVQPIYVGILCSLQLRNPHTGKRNRVVSIHRDYRARAGLMRLT
jgi:hypothetical protein